MNASLALVHGRVVRWRLVVTAPRRSVVTAGCVLAFAACLDQASAEGMKLEPFSYQQGFEGESPKLDLWAKNGPSKVNFSGPTEERRFEGKRSLKLDVTLAFGSFSSACYVGRIRGRSCWTFRGGPNVTDLGPLT